ncbi:hypothetical protein ACJJTC_013877 [Scirpophaga incertulas]
MFLTPPAKMVNTRSTVRRDKEKLEKDEMPQQQNKTVTTQTPASSVKMESHPPPKVSSAAASSRSRKSTTSLEARRKKLMLEAERKKAEIRVQLIDKELEADLANLEEYSSHDGRSSARRDVESWIDKSQMELDRLVVPEYGPKTDDPPPLAAVAVGTTDTVQMLAAAVKNLTASPVHHNTDFIVAFSMKELECMWSNIIGPMVITALCSECMNVSTMHPVRLDASQRLPNSKEIPIKPHNEMHCCAFDVFCVCEHHFL